MYVLWHSGAGRVYACDWFRTSGGMIRVLFCLLARSVVGAPWLCEHPFKLVIDSVFTQVKIRGEGFLFFTFPKFPELEEPSFTFSPFKKWKQEDNDWKRPTLDSSLSLPEALASQPQPFLEVLAQRSQPPPRDRQGESVQKAEGRRGNRKES